MKIFNPVSSKFKDENWFEVSLILLLISLPFEMFFSSMGLIVFFLGSIMTLLFKRQFKFSYHKTDKLWLLLFSSPIIVQVLGLLNTENLKQGLSLVEIKSPALFISLFIYLISNTITYSLKKVLKTYSIVVFIYYSIQLLLWFFNDYRGTDYQLNHHLLSKRIPHSHIYQSLFMGTSGIIALYYFLKSSFRKKDFIFLAIALGALVQQLIIGGRTGFASSIIVYTYLLIFMINKTKFRILTLLSLFGFIFIAFQYLDFTERFQYLLTKDKMNNPLFLRVFKWNCSWNIMLDHPWTGVGTGDVQPFLNECYKKGNYNIAFEKSFNTHNEFLEEGARHGFFSFLLFISTLLLPTIYSLLKKNHIYVSMMIFLGLNMLTENVLQRQVGVIVFSALNAVIFFHFLFRNKQQPLVE